MPPPKILDIESLLPRAHPENMQYRDLEEVEMVVVHYDAVHRPDIYDPISRYRDEANYHIGKVWGYKNTGAPIYGFGLMYHYKIDAAGLIYRCNDETLVTWHARGANPFGLAVCVDLGDGQHATEAQLRSLAQLLNWLHTRRDMSVAKRGAWGHGELTQYGNSTLCPGSLKPYVINYRLGKWGQQEPAPEPETLDFPQTGFSVANGFRDLWVQYGLFVCGYPTSAEYEEADTGLTVQRFENVVMEYRNAPGYPRFGARKRKGE